MRRLFKNNQDHALRPVSLCLMLTALPTRRAWNHFCTAPFMKHLFVLLAAVTMLACNNDDKKANSATSAEPTKATRNFTEELAKLDKAHMANLTKAVELYKEEVNSEKDGDQALPVLMQYITFSLDTLNDALAANSAEYASLVVDSVTKPTPKQLSLVKDMMTHHTQLQSDGEGGIYLEYDYNWLMKTISDEVSAPVRTYLQVTAMEASQPFSKDAAIVIPPQALADRALVTEQVAAQPLPGNFSNDIKEVNAIYIKALLFGTDNTPSLIRGTTNWVPAFAQVYQYVLTKSPQSALANKIKQWQAVVASGNRKQVDEYIATNWR